METITDVRIFCLLKRRHPKCSPIKKNCQLHYLSPLSYHDLGLTNNKDNYVQRYSLR